MTLIFTWVCFYVFSVWIWKTNRNLHQPQTNYKRKLPSRGKKCLNPFLYLPPVVVLTTSSKLQKKFNIEIMARQPEGAGPANRSGVLLLSLHLSAPLWGGRDFRIVIEMLIFLDDELSDGEAFCGILEISKEVTINWCGSDGSSAEWLVARKRGIKVGLSAGRWAWKNATFRLKWGATDRYRKY